MKKAILSILAIFALIVVISILANLSTLKTLRHAMTLFDDGKIVQNFLHMEESFDTRTIEASPNASPLPQRSSYQLPESFTWEDSTFTYEDYMEQVNTTGLLIIHRDTIVYESYANGLEPSTTHISWSVAKSFVSALVGIAFEEGLINSVEDPITDYLPELANSGYDQVRIVDILQMSTGIAFNEDYRDFNSDINRFGRYFALGKPLDDYVTTMKRERAPGTYNHYVSINTQVLGMLVSRVAGMNLCDYLQKKIWDPIGMEYDAQWIIDEEGTEFAVGGLNVTLRDYARFGLLYMHEGSWDSTEIVPADWVAASINTDKPHLEPGPNPNSGSDYGYGYQWWIPDATSGDFFAAGIYNQYIYISPAKDLVITKLTANHLFKEKDDRSKDIHVALLQRIAEDF